MQMIQNLRYIRKTKCIDESSWHGNATQFCQSAANFFTSPNVPKCGHYAKTCSQFALRSSSGNFYVSTDRSTEVITAKR